MSLNLAAEISDDSAPSVTLADAKVATDAIPIWAQITGPAARSLKELARFVWTGFPA
jgi:hypothetical protein